MPSNGIELLAVKPTDKGSLRAFVTIKVGGVTIHECRIVQQEGQKAWLSMPQRTWETPEGKKKYFAFVELSDSLKQRVNDTIVDAWMNWE